MSTVLGIDIGGSGVKGAPVDLETGELVGERHRIETPKESTPENIAEVIGQIIEHFADAIAPDAPVGITVPAPVVHGVVPFIANLDQTWKGLNAEQFFTEKLGRKVTIVNDADAAGVAEVAFGAAKGHPGLVILTTLGTGIGSAIINNGVLLPNTELGHLELNGKDAETVAAASAREREGLSYDEWAPRLQEYYQFVEMLFSPDLFVVGGGVSKKAEKFLPQLSLKAPIIPAKLQNQAGIVGAAWLAVHRPVDGAAMPEIESMGKTLEVAEDARVAVRDKKKDKKDKKK